MAAAIPPPCTRGGALSAGSSELARGFGFCGVPGCSCPGSRRPLWQDRREVPNSSHLGLWLGGLACHPPRVCTPSLRCSGRDQPLGFGWSQVARSCWQGRVGRGGRARRDPRWSWWAAARRLGACGGRLWNPAGRAFLTRPCTDGGLHCVGPLGWYTAWSAKQDKMCKIACVWWGWWNFLQQEGMGKGAP